MQRISRAPVLSATRRRVSCWITPTRPSRGSRRGASAWWRSADGSRRHARCPRRRPRCARRGREAWWRYARSSRRCGAGARDPSSRRSSCPPCPTPRSPGGTAGCRFRAARQGACPHPSFRPVASHDSSCASGAARRRLNGVWQRAPRAYPRGIAAAWPRYAPTGLVCGAPSARARPRAPPERRPRAARPGPRRPESLPRRPSSRRLSFLLLPKLGFHIQRALAGNGQAACQVLLGPVDGPGVFELSRRVLEAQVEQLLARRVDELNQLGVVEIMDLDGLHCCPIPSRSTNFVFKGSLWPASRMASRASSSSTPESSNITRPGLTTATQPSGEPLPDPMRVSAGFWVTGLSGKMLIQTLPPRLILRVMAIRAASICLLVIQPHSTAFSPYSPNSTRVPPRESPGIRPRCCFL